jgi:hypothetical protein
LTTSEGSVDGLMPFFSSARDSSRDFHDEATSDPSSLKLSPECVRPDGRGS